MLARAEVKSEGLEHNAAEEFLEQLRPGGPWLLVAISPDDGAIVGRTVKTAEEVRTFVQTHNGSANIYYSVNPTRTAISKKPSKGDIAQIEYVLADLDPNADESSEAAKNRYLGQLMRDGFEPRPTVLVDSGNGIQALWRLKEPIPLGAPVREAEEGKLGVSSDDRSIIAGVEARSEAMMHRLGAKAGTQNIDRILRLPGTINLPNAKKRKEGRVRCPTKLIDFNDEVYSLDAFSLPVVGTEQISLIRSAPSVDFDKLSEVDVNALPVSDRIKNIIRTGDASEHNGDRSAALFAVLLAMVGRQCSDEQMASVLWFEPIGAHVHDQGDPRRCLLRQIEKAREKATKADAATEFSAVLEDEILELNKNHALVLVGGKSAILRESPEEAGGYILLAHSAFEHWHANRLVENNKGKKVAISKVWMTHPDRRQYEGLVFAPNRHVPGHYNLWRGFAVLPCPGDCSKFLDHIRDNVCQGSQELYDWVIGWFAQLVQQPEVKLGTALILRGKEGCGKSFVGKTIGSLLGPHYLPVSKPELITGRFNGHLGHCLLLQAEEAFWAGDRGAAGALKDLVTNDDLVLEFKGLESVRMKNYTRVLATSNEDWVVPAGPTARRFAVLDVGEARVGDKPYFAAIAHELDNGGREALLQHLLRVDLTKVDLRSVPKTGALFEQKLQSLNPEQAWWFGVLSRGRLPTGCTEPRCCRTDRLFDEYIEHSNRIGIKRKSVETSLGLFLSKQLPGLIKRESRGGCVYEFPPLAECRRAFANQLQQEVDWPERGDWLNGSAQDDFGCGSP